MPKMSTFLPAMCAAFFIRQRPASRRAKPACRNRTRTAVITTQIVLAAMRSSVLRAKGLDLLQAQRRAVVGHVPDRRRPDDPVARLVAAPRRVRDRRHHGLGLLVRDD